MLRSKYIRYRLCPLYASVLRRNIAHVLSPLLCYYISPTTVLFIIFFLILFSSVYAKRMYISITIIRTRYDRAASRRHLSSSVRGVVENKYKIIP